MAFFKKTPGIDGASNFIPDLTIKDWAEERLSSFMTEFNAAGKVKDERSVNLVKILQSLIHELAFASLNDQLKDFQQIICNAAYLYILIESSKQKVSQSKLSFTSTSLTTHRQVKSFCKPIYSPKQMLNVLNKASLTEVNQNKLYGFLLTSEMSDMTKVELVGDLGKLFVDILSLCKEKMATQCNILSLPKPEY
jgi:hypothetical protein